MQIECIKHQRLLSFFCSHPSCQSYLCRECCNDHISHQILNTNQFADYALKEIKRRQQQTPCNSSVPQHLGNKVTIDYLKRVKESVMKLADTMRGITDSIFKRFVDVLETIVVSTKEERKVNNGTEAVQEKEWLQEIRSELLLAKENEHFLAIQQAWEKLRGSKNGIATDGSNSFSELFVTLEDIKTSSEGLMSRLSRLKEDTHHSLIELKSTSLSTAELIPKTCSSCKHNNDIYLIQQCSHGLCLDCARSMIYEKTSSKGLKVIDMEFECKTCGFEGSVSQLIHEECGCIISAKEHRKNSFTPYLWDKVGGKFQWPVCRQGKALTQEDLFFIYGGSAFTFLYECLSLKKLAEAARENREYKYMTLARERPQGRNTQAQDGHGKGHRS
eukprot:TRINITY_DN9535_c0_g1_i3.p1 TRINITY_DN9535_c0_g1~~TRINITY_DN9535_c0_g1_i3.p1  ORF type:complete len:388 (+),score=88.01 TRINITY_DN9535_c0_g1_i3:240-1403(+)